MLLVLSLLVGNTVPVTLSDWAVAVLARLLALEHLAVANNAVALALRNVVTLLGLLTGGRCPGEVVAANLHVVVSEFTELVIVHTEELSFLGCAQVKAGNVVDGVRDQSAHDECVGGAGDDVSNLLVNRGKVASEEATKIGSNLSIAAETDDVVCAEEGVEKKTDHSGDAVLSEHIHGVINLDPVLDLGGEVGNNASYDAENDGSPGSDETRSGSSGDKTRNETGAPADHRPLAGKAPIKEHPGHGTEHTSEVGVPASHCSAEVGTEGRTAVECEPAEPQEDSAESDERDVVRAEVEHHLLLATSENHRVGECRHSRNDFDGSTTGIVKNAPAESPAARSPYPACDWAVDKGGPQEDEHEERHEATTLRDSTSNNGGGDSAELHLVEGEEEVGDES